MHRLLMARTERRLPILCLDRAPCDVLRGRRRVAVRGDPALPCGMGARRRRGDVLVSAWSAGLLDELDVLEHDANARRAARARARADRFRVPDVALERV